MLFRQPRPEFDVFGGYKSFFNYISSQITVSFNIEITGGGSRGGGGLPYMALTGTCGPIGYGSQGVLF